MSDIDDMLKTADMLEIVASGGNGAELVDLPWLLGVAVKELRETDAIRAERERLRGALQDARECIEAWACYANEYFREKHDLAGDLARIDAALASVEKEKSE